MDCTQRQVYPEAVLCADGVIAFARGRNAYLPSSLCEACPEVQAYWMEWVSECLLADVDGVDWRISNHSSWTDLPELYGFNEPILQEYERRYGLNPDVEPYDPELIGALRGEVYDRFLWGVKRRLSAAGKRLQLHLEVESFRPDAPPARRVTRPGNMSFNWRRWLRTGLADEATLMGAIWTPQRIVADELGQEMVREAGASGVPIYLRHPVWLSRDGKVHADRLECVYHAGGFSGYNLYETQGMYDPQGLDANGRLQFIPGLLEELRSRIESLGFL